MPVRPEDRPGMVGGTATLEVTPQEALKLAAVQGNGTLMLLLRPFNDTTTMREADVDPATIIPPPPPPEKKNETPTVVTAADVKAEGTKPQEERVAVVTVITGSSVSERVFYLDDRGQVKRSELREAPGKVEATRPAAKPEGISPATLEALMKKRDEGTN